MKLTKPLVIDTNIILLGLNNLNNLRNTKIVIPSSIMTEIDKFKSDMGEKGKNARDFSRMLFDYIEKGENLLKGVKFGNNKLYIRQSPVADSVDLSIMELCKKVNGVLFTEDANLRIIAHMNGLETRGVDLVVEKTTNEQRVIKLTDKQMDEFIINKSLSNIDGLVLNEYVALQHDDNLMGTIYDGVKLKSIRSSLAPFNIAALNLEQAFALDALMNDNIKLVCLIGPSGTGKTLLTMATGLFKVLDRGSYNSLIVSKPVIPMGKDLGYLPGEIQDKVMPWMGSMNDAIETILGGKGKTEATTLIENGVIKLEPMTYMRGRSFNREFIFIDEAQNISIHEIKTIMTRVGKDTKIILSGDPNQIDTPQLDSINNGLVYVANKFSGNELAAMVNLNQTERSELAAAAVKLL